MQEGREIRLGLIMPCESHPIDFEHAVLTAEAFDEEAFRRATGTYRTMVAEMKVGHERPAQDGYNPEPRLRMAALYFFANA